MWVEAGLDPLLLQALVHEQRELPIVAVESDQASYAPRGGSTEGRHVLDERFREPAAAQERRGEQE